MLDLYAFAIPNSVEVPIMLKKLGLDYTLHSVNIRQGGHKTHEFLDP